MGLETMDLNGLGIELQTLFLVCEELLDILALISLKLDHLSHLRIDNNGAIASELLLNDLEDFLLIEFLGETLDSSQRLTTIALLNTNVYIILRLLDVSKFLGFFSEGVKGLEVLGNDF